MSCMSDLSQMVLWHILAFLLLIQITQILSVETAFLLMPPKSRRRKVSKMAIIGLKDNISANKNVYCSTKICGTSKMEGGLNIPLPASYYPNVVLLSSKVFFAMNDVRC